MSAQPTRSLRRRLFRVAGVCFLVAAGVTGLANYLILTANETRLHESVSSLSSADVGLVLGANATLKDGRPNLHFLNRINAAAALYRAGKVRHLLVSGDNHRVGYDEPEMMKTALVARGVPAAAITCDYAGFRTLDSVVRAQRIFGLQRCIIITQRYHNTRALEIARAIGLDAQGFCAPEVDLRDSFLTECREVAARTVTMFDLYVWHRQPHFLGKAEPIQIASR